MDPSHGLRLIEETRVIVVVRGVEPSCISDVAAALLRGGVSVAEVALNTPNALSMIRELNERFSDRMFIGAGTVLDIDDAKQAIDAGASFLVAPSTNRAVIEYAVARGVPMIPGAMTPSEVVTAWKAGATAIKIFPAGTLGLRYIRELRGPLNDVRLVPFGGVDDTNISQYLAAGCYAVGVGSAIVNLDDIRAGRYAAVEERARRLMAARYIKEGEQG